MRKYFIIASLLVVALPGNPATPIASSSSIPKHFIPSTDPVSIEQIETNSLLASLSEKEKEFMRDLIGPVFELYEQGFFTNESTASSYLDINLFHKDVVTAYPITEKKDRDANVKDIDEFMKKIVGLTRSGPNKK